jgi:hypothetical protein
MADALADKNHEKSNTKSVENQNTGGSPENEGFSLN